VTGTSSPIPGAHRGEIGEQATFRWQISEQIQRLRPQPHNYRHLRFLSRKANCVAFPIHILALATGKVTLTATRMPAQLIKHLPLRVHLRPDNRRVFFRRDGPLLVERRLAPLQSRDDRF
jgi:hypothetical protein